MVEVGTIENDAIYLTSGWQKLHGRDLRHSIQVRGGRFFWPLQPRADEMNLDIIVGAISREGRFANQTIREYNVATHSIQMALYMMHLGHSKDSMMVKWALFHDASEAIMKDLPYPLKIQAVMEGYNKAESKLQEVVRERFEIDTSKIDFEEFEKHDRMMGCAEKLHYFGLDGIAYFRGVGRDPASIAGYDKMLPFVVERTPEEADQCFRVVALELFGIK